MDYAKITKACKTSELINIYNRITPTSPVRKFADRKTAEARVAKALAEANYDVKHLLENPDISADSKAAIEKVAAITETPKPEAKKATSEAGEGEPEKKKRTRSTELKAPKKVGIPGPKGNYKGKVIKIVVDQLKATEGSGRAQSFAAMKNGMTFDEYRHARGRTSDLRFAVAKGYVVME